MTSVLVVEHDQPSLNALRGLLKGQEGAWRTVFAGDDDAARRELERDAFDVVLVGVPTPVGDDATILGEVKHQYPDTIRILLHPDANDRRALGATRIAHQVLAKTVSAAELVGAVDRSCELKALLDHEELRRAVAGTHALPSSPTLYAEFVDAVADPMTSLDRVASIIERDVALCAKILQLVNSAFWGLRREVSTVSEAAVYLGVATLEALVLGAEAFRAFAPAAARAGFSIEAFEMHSRLVARTTARLAPSGVPGDSAFMAGMLHDVGKLVLASNDPDRFVAATTEAARTGRPLHDVEREQTGVTHAEVGAYLLALWNLPHLVVGAVVDHHSSGRPRDALAGAVRIANELVQTHAPSDSSEHGVLAELRAGEQVEAQVSALLARQNARRTAA